MKPISLQMYTVREQTKADPVGVLKEIARIGYGGVEGGVQGLKPPEYRKLLNDLGLVCSSGGCPVPTKENVNQIADTARTLGCDLLMVGKGPDDYKTPDRIKATAEAFQAGAALLKPHGITLCFHNHWWEFVKVEGRLPYEMVLELAPAVSSELDIYWACNFGEVDVPAVLKKHAKRIPLLHVKDGPLVKDQPHMAVGKGKVDVPAIVKSADPSVLRWLVVELDHCATDMMQAVRDSYAYLTSTGLAKGRA
jgi:sugar phosphate isomerase/epimerase